VIGFVRGRVSLQEREERGVRERERERERESRGGYLGDVTKEGLEFFGHAAEGEEGALAAPAGG